MCLEFLEKIISLPSYKEILFRPNMEGNIKFLSGDKRIDFIKKLLNQYKNIKIYVYIDLKTKNEIFPMIVLEDSN